MPQLADGTLVPPLPQSGGGLPEHSRRDLHRAEDDALSVQLRPGFYTHRDHDASTRRSITPPYVDNPANGPIYPSYRAEDG